jgi:hypothetical protein
MHDGQSADGADREAVPADETGVALIDRQPLDVGHDRARRLALDRGQACVQLRILLRGDPELQRRDEQTGRRAGASQQREPQRKRRRVLARGAKRPYIHQEARAHFWATPLPRLGCAFPCKAAARRLASKVPTLRRSSTCFLHATPESEAVAALRSIRAHADQLEAFIRDARGY